MMPYLAPEAAMPMSSTAPRLAAMNARLVIHEGPIWENGYLTIQDKPGYGIELNPDVARAHLAPGETWWG